MPVSSHLEIGIFHLHCFPEQPIINHKPTPPTSVFASVGLSRGFENNRRNNLDRTPSKPARSLRDKGCSTKKTCLPAMHQVAVETGQSNIQIQPGRLPNLARSKNHRDIFGGLACQIFQSQPARFLLLQKRPMVSVELEMRPCVVCRKNCSLQNSVRIKVATNSVSESPDGQENWYTKSGNPNCFFQKMEWFKNLKPCLFLKKRAIKAAKRAIICGFSIISPPLHPP